MFEELSEVKRGIMSKLEDIEQELDKKFDSVRAFEGEAERRNRYLERIEYLLIKIYVELKNSEE